MRLRLHFISIFLLSSCISVREADTSVWNGVPVAELESHPVFKKMPLEKKSLTDGSVLWTYTSLNGFYQRCDTDTISFLRQATKPTTCLIIERTCANQFLVDRQGIVQSYKAIGNNCNTNCSYRPASHPCQ